MDPKSLMRFPSAIAGCPAVDAWLHRSPDEKYALARKWFARMKQCGNDVTELMHDGCPTACVGDAAFAYVGVFTRHVNVGFFFGAMLKDPCGILEGTGKRMRHVKLTLESPVDESALGALIEAAYVDIKQRVEEGWQ